MTSLIPPHRHQQQTPTTSHPLYSTSLHYNPNVSTKYASHRKNKQHHHHLIPRSSNKQQGGLGDDLLDFIVAGPKLRKWYGQEGQVLPRDKDEDEQPVDDIDLAQESAGPRDHILVLDADTIPMAEQVLLQLILARANIKATFKDLAQAKTSFGTYVDIVPPAALQKTLSSKTSTVVFCGSIDAQILSMVCTCGVPHVVLLSAVGAPSQSGIASLFSASAREMSVLEDSKREKMIRESGIQSFVIVRVSKLTDEQGGVMGISVTDTANLPAVDDSMTSLSSRQGSISREDAAKVIAEASLLQQSSLSGKRVILQVENNGNAGPPQSWESVFASSVVS